MQVPSIHLNGTSREDLTPALIDAGEAVRNAIEAVCRTGLNARDYYPQGPDAFSAARDDHFSRVKSLETVLNELQALAEAIQ